MRQAHITYQATDLDFRKAAQLATSFAEKDSEMIEPVLVSWYDRRMAQMSPAIAGANLDTRWHDYGESHSGKLEVDVGDDYAFIYADSSAFDPYEESPYVNLRDAKGNEFVCQAGLLCDRHVPSKEACVALDEWTSKLT